MAIHITARGKLAKRLWVLDADLEAAFDRLSHQHILVSLGTFPARELVRRWLQAGVLEDGRLTPTGEGTPAWTGYWDQRRRRARLPVDTATWHLLRRQRGRCPLCRGLLLHADHLPQGPEEWQQWHTATRTVIRKHAITSVMDLGTPDELAAHHLIHAYCRRLGDDTSRALLPGPEPSGLA